MKKLILPLFTSILFAGDINQTIIELENHNYDQAIKQLKECNETKQTNYLLGKAYFEKHLTWTDYIFALQYFKKVNTPESYYYLGKMYQDGLGVQKNPTKALDYFKKSNTKEAKFELAKDYLYGKNTLKNPKLAIKLLKESSKAGDTKAQLLLGKLYLENNDFIDKDLEEAEKWLYLSAKNGNIEAKKLYNQYKLYRYKDTDNKD